MKLLVQFAVALFVYMACAYADTAKELKAGVILGLTGGAAYHADAVRKGIELAKHDLVAEGWKVDLAFEDDQTNPARGVSALQALAARGFRTFFGPLWAFQVKAVQPILEQQKLLALIPTGASDANGGPSKQIFNLCPPRLLQKAPIEKWAREQGVKHGLSLTNPGDWGDTHDKAFVDGIEAAGGTVKVEKFSTGADIAELRALVTRHREERLDAVFVTGSPADVATVVRAVRELKLPWKILATEDLPDAVNLGLVGKNELNGELYAVGLGVDEAFVEKYQKHYGERPKLYADRAYLGVMSLAAAIKRAEEKKIPVAEALREEQFDQNGDSKIDSYRVIRASQRQ